MAEAARYQDISVYKGRGGEARGVVPAEGGGPRGSEGDQCGRFVEE